MQLLVKISRCTYFIFLVLTILSRSKFGTKWCRSIKFCNLWLNEIRHQLHYLINDVNRIFAANLSTKVEAGLSPPTSLLLGRATTAVPSYPLLIASDVEFLIPVQRIDPRRLTTDCDHGDCPDCLADYWKVEACRGTDSQRRGGNYLRYVLENNFLEKVPVYLFDSVHFVHRSVSSIGDDKCGEQ